METPSQGATRTLFLVFVDTDNWVECWIKTTSKLQPASGVYFRFLSNISLGKLNGHSVEQSLKLPAQFLANDQVMLAIRQFCEIVLRGSKQHEN